MPLSPHHDDTRDQTRPAEVMLSLPILSVVVPAYNEEATISQVLKRLHCLSCLKEGSGQFRVKMHAKPQLTIFQSVRDAKILWFSCRVFDTLVEASRC
jgi:hypothetical protein